MSSERWQHVRALFDEFLDLDQERRREKIAELSADDPALAASVKALLAADDAADRELEDIELALFLSDTDIEPGDPLRLAGKSLGHFRILEPLDSGGMGAVYRAEDTRLKRIVAVKLPLPGYRFDDSARKRFFQEARSVAALDHPNLCSIFEIGKSDEGHPFLAMPLYPGESLKSRLAREGRLPISHAVSIARQIADGLTAAHGAGIVHRDIKPGNVMLLPDDTVKILDFGLAKVADASITGPRTRLGTVAYMAPEQILENAVDSRADLWALGVLLYECVTGERPFNGERDVAVARAILHDEPLRPSKLRPEIPEALEEILQRLLSKSPAERPATAQEVASAITAIERGISVSPFRVLRRRWSAVTGWQRRRSYRSIAFATVAIVLLSAAFIGVRDLRNPPAAETAEPGSIAVLPFQNLSADREQEYLSDGITDELITHLTKFNGLRVAARTSTFQFKNRNTDLAEVGRQLGVSKVVNGTVQRNRTRVRVSVQLSDVSTGFHIWAETYDREASDMLQIQAEISRSIATALRIQLPQTPSDRSQSTRNAEAHDLYLKGRFFWNQRTEAALVRATSYFRDAVTLDPEYAEAWSGLADVEIAPRSGRPARRFARAKEAGAKALLLDPDLPEAHLSMGWISMWYDRDWSAANQHLQRAIELNPRHAWAVAWYAAYLAAVGRLEESMPLIERSLALDPLSYIHSTYVGTHYLWARRDGVALDHFRQTIEFAPTFFMAHWGIARVHLNQGNFATAIAGLETGGGDYTGLHRSGLLGYAHARAGNAVRARQILTDMDEHERNGEYVAPVDRAIIHIGLGQTTEALDWLERVVEDRGARIFLIDPIFDPVRGEQRFTKLVEQLGLKGRGSLR